MAQRLLIGVPRCPAAETHARYVQHFLSTGKTGIPAATLPATLGMMAVMLPAFFWTWDVRHSKERPAFGKAAVVPGMCSPGLSARKIRPYKTNNYYAILMKGGMTHDPVLESPNLNAILGKVAKVSRQSVY